MDSKNTAEKSVRRRRSNTAAQQPQKSPQQRPPQQRPPQQKPPPPQQQQQQPARHRSNAAGKQNGIQPNPKSVAVVPSSRQSPGQGCPRKLRKGRKKKARGQSARELHRDGEGPLPLPLPSPSAAGQLKRRQDTPRPNALQVAHDQLELLLARIEHEGGTSTPQRRKSSPAKTVRRQMEHPPPVPTVSPLSSARSRISGASTAGVVVNASMSSRVVPFTENPQQLQPEKQMALYDLLSQSRPQDKDIVNALRAEISSGGDPSMDNMRLTLQMLPLALRPGNSPYTECFWEGHRYLRERQRLHERLQPDDVRYKEVKILRSPNGQLFLSQTLEDELKDEKHVLDFVEAELQRGQLPGLLPEQQARQQQAINERIELDRQKQQVSDCRAHYQLAEQNRSEHEVTKRLLRKAKILKRQRFIQAIRDARHQKRWQEQQQHEQEQKQEQVQEQEQEQEQQQEQEQEQEQEQLVIKPGADKDQPSECAEKPQQKVQCDANAGGDVETDPDGTPRSSQEGLEDELADARQQRLLFQRQCQRSDLYGNPKCQTPWTLFTDITKRLVDQLTKNMVAELHHSIAVFIKEFVDKEALKDTD